MTTPNIEELIAELQQLANEIEISYRIESIEEAVKALQSQAERIADLERVLNCCDIAECSTVPNSPGALKNARKALSKYKGAK